jgi:hypothetical protein
VLTNSVGSATTAPATLTVTAGPASIYYFGSLGTAQGDWALEVRADGSAVFIGFATSPATAFTYDVTVSPSGAFTTGEATAGAAPKGGISARAASTSVSGQISGGQVSGTVAGLGIAISGAEDTSVDTLPGADGFYASPQLYAQSGALYAVVGPGGQFLFVISQGALSDAAQGSVGANGQFSGPTIGGGTLSVALNATGQALSGTYTRSGSSSTFMGISDTGSSTARLSNLSARADVGTGQNILIAGFVVGGVGNKDLLVRGIGPSLSQFGVSGVLATPELTLFNQSSAAIGENAGWGGSQALSAAFSNVGAFAIPATSADSAMLSSISPGGYTAQVTGMQGGTGVALAELYDEDAGTSGSRLINISARADVGTGANILIAGFSIAGNAPEQVLIRGIGPGLSQFNLSGVLANPQLTLFDASGKQLAQNSAWGGGAALASVFSQVGAFSIASASSDDALLITLPPGDYTAQISGANGSTGNALVEVYEVPQ